MGGPKQSAMDSGCIINQGRETTDGQQGTDNETKGRNAPTTSNSLVRRCAPGVSTLHLSSRLTQHAAAKPPEGLRSVPQSSVSEPVIMDRTQGMDRTIYCDADSLWLTDATALWAQFDGMGERVLFGMTEENEEPEGRCLWYSEGAQTCADTNRN